jgi:copper oxidase (laccase) domain-containing protein
VLELLLKDKDPAMRAAVARAVGTNLDPTAVALLVEALKDENAQVRLQVVHSLQVVGPSDKPRAVAALVEAHKDADALVRSQAAQVLRLIDPKAAARAAGK